MSRPRTFLRSTLTLFGSVAVLFCAATGNQSFAQNISTVAGTGTLGFSGDGGQATSAQLNSPFGVALDASGNLYIADISNHRIRKVNAATGIISTVATTAPTSQSPGEPESAKYQPGPKASNPA